jgi:hypothetical protein
MKRLDVARATLRTTFRPRSDLRVVRWFFDLRLVAAKVARKLRRLTQAKARKNRGLKRFQVATAKLQGNSNLKGPEIGEAVLNIEI